MSGSENSQPTDLNAIESNELFRRAHAGCAESCAELSRRFRPRLVSLVTGRLGGRYSDAEDIAQEAIVRAFQHFDRFDPQYRFSTWLFTIAIRLARDYTRSRSRRPQQVSLEGFDLPAKESNIAGSAQQEEVDNLWQTAQRILSEDQYIALWLRYGEDKSTVEIAKHMRRTRIGVRVLLHRARLALVAEVGKAESSRGSSTFGKRGRE